MEFTEQECDLLGEALIKLLEVKREALTVSKNAKLPFDAQDFAIPAIESLISRIENAS